MRPLQGRSEVLAAKSRLRASPANEKRGPGAVPRTPASVLTVGRARPQTSDPPGSSTFAPSFSSLSMKFS